MQQRHYNGYLYNRYKRIYVYTCTFFLHSPFLTHFPQFPPLCDSGVLFSSYVLRGDPAARCSLSIKTPSNLHISAAVTAVNAGQRRWSSRRRRRRGRGQRRRRQQRQRRRLRLSSSVGLIVAANEKQLLR